MSRVGDTVSWLWALLEVLGLVALVLLALL